MTITTTKNNGCLTLELEGRLDTTTAPELETVIKNGLEGVDRLVLDMEGLGISWSSAGLRVNSGGCTDCP